MNGKEDYSAYLNYGIQVEKGLAYSGGSMDAYLEIAGMFVKNSEINRGKLERFLADQNEKDYGILAHAVKGNARMLGAEKLADEAFLHEKESKAGNLAYAAGHWEELCRLWDEAKEGLEMLAREQGAGIEDPYAPVAAGGEAVLELTQEELDQAAEWIDAFDTERALDQMKEWLSHPLKPELYERIRGALAALEDDFDDVKAMELLKG